jgi:hypothetical protein
MIGQEDRWYARRLPDDFVSRSGDGAARLHDVVRENWWGHDGNQRARLVRALLPILSDLLHPGARVTDEHRDLCEGIVDAWLVQA